MSERPTRTPWQGDGFAAARRGVPTRASDNVFVVLPFEKVLQEETVLAMDYRFPVSQHVREILAFYANEKKDTAVA